jgi:hypothetical protein
MILVKIADDMYLNLDHVVETWPIIRKEHEPHEVVGIRLRLMGGDIVQYQDAEADTVRAWLDTFAIAPRPAKD